MSRFEAGFSNIYVYDFLASDYFRNRSLISSYVEIGEMDMKVFRDKRKEFRHLIKPAFQDMIYNYPGILQIDSIWLLWTGMSFLPCMLKKPTKQEVSDSMKSILNFTT